MDRGVLQEQAGGRSLPVTARQEGLLNKRRQALIPLQKIVPTASSQVMQWELLCLLLGTSAYLSITLCRASRPWPWQ